MSHDRTLVFVYTVSPCHCVLMGFILIREAGLECFS